MPPALALDPLTDTGRGTRPAEVAPRVDERALAAIYGEHHDFVWRSLVRLGVGEARVEDGVHDVFMVVARRLHEFEGRATMRSWLFAITMRVAQSIRRDAARRVRNEARLAAEPVADHVPHENADASRTLHALLDCLDDDKRAVFVMAELEGMTAPEIAEVVGAKLATVYSRLRLAREALAREVQRRTAYEQTKRGGR